MQKAEEIQKVNHFHPNTLNYESLDYSKSNQIKDEIALMTIEQVFQQIGSQGKYQKIILIIFLIQWLITSFVFIGPLYFFPQPEFICGTGDQSSDCTELNGGCTFGVLKHSQSVGQSILMFAPAIGSFVMSIISDSRGRKYTMLLGWALCVLGFLGTYFCLNQFMLMGTLFLSSFALANCNDIALIMINEQSGEQFRQSATTLMFISWGFDQLLLIPVFIFIKSWKNIFLWFISFPSIGLLILKYCLVNESPRFIMTKYNGEKELKNALLDQIFTNIAKINGEEPIDLSKIELISEDLLDEQNQEALTNSKKRRLYTHLDLCQYPSLRKISIPSCIIWLFVMMMYYGSQYVLDDFGENVYINAAIVAGAEIFTFTILYFTIDLINRKPFTLITSTITIICCGFFFFTDSIPKWASSTLVGLVRIFNVSTELVYSVYIEELYPTKVRSLGMGLQTCIGLLGSALAPFVITYSQEMNIQPMISMAILGIPSLFLNFMLRETKGLPLQNEITEEMNMHKYQIITEKFESVKKSIDSNSLQDSKISNKTSLINSFYKSGK